MAKRETDAQKYVRMIKDKLMNKDGAVTMTLEEFEATFSTERYTNKWGSVSKRGKMLLKTTGKMVEYESKLEQKMLEILDNCGEVVAIKTQALVLEYHYRGDHYYYPDIVFLTKEGKCCVLEIKDTISMFKMKTQKKYECLDYYCRMYGLAYAMLNDKDDFETLCDNPENPEVSAFILKLVNARKSVSWAYIKDTCKEKGYTIQEIMTVCSKYNLKVSSSKTRVWAFSIKK